MLPPRCVFVISYLGYISPEREKDRELERSEYIGEASPIVSSQPKIKKEAFEGN